MAKKIMVKEFNIVMNHRKGVDFFSANHAFTARVREYGDSYVWGVTLRARLRKEVEKWTGHLSALDDPKLDGAETEKLRTRYMELLKDARKNYDAEAKAHANFAWSDADEVLYRAYAGAETVQEFRSAVVAWFAGYGLDVYGKYYVEYMLTALQGLKTTSARVNVNTGKFTTSKRTKSDFLKTLYGLLCDDLIAVNLITLKEYPEDIRAMYAPKAKKSTK